MTRRRSVKPETSIQGSHAGAGLSSKDSTVARELSKDKAMETEPGGPLVGSPGADQLGRIRS